MKKHRREKKLFKIDQRFSAKRGRIVKLSKLIKILNPPAPMEEPLPHDSAFRPASGLPLAFSRHGDTVSDQRGEEGTKLKKDQRLILMGPSPSRLN